jgi:hypothetical protein
VDGLHYLLARAQTPREVLIEDSGAHRVDKRPRHAHVHVGFEKGCADLAKRLVDVALAETSAASQAPEDSFEAVRKRVEHGL